MLDTDTHTPMVPTPTPTAPTTTSASAPLILSQSPRLTPRLIPTFCTVDTPTLMLDTDIHMPMAPTPMPTAPTTTSASVLLRLSPRLIQPSTTVAVMDTTVIQGSAIVAVTTTIKCHV